MIDKFLSLFSMDMAFLVAYVIFMLFVVATY